ncbi:MAG TPA: transposase [Candidatus Aveggerthella stercoripullorum]|uniref:Transposase n=1 Tax=Candidatus Aveggerthella stercoripullorum TaxID=2840688 RepID=A0A9D1A1D7_9ACTN|nr:transposase [Candidatus Aveggerthella stercoripullorum]
MPRPARAESPVNLYHVTMRGIGRQLIFEDDADRKSFLARLKNVLDASGSIDCLAWCLMVNHVHLLFEGPLQGLSILMRTLGAGYAAYFNARHDRVGHLFQGRFGSEPVMDERQLLATVRYIHLNPTKAYGIPAAAYSWSSYQELLGGKSFLANRDRVISLFGDVDFASFHESYAGDEDGAAVPSRGRIGDDEALRIAISIATPHSLSDVKALPKKERNELLRRFRSAGLTIKQIERLTSIGRGIIARV